MISNLQAIKITISKYPFTEIGCNSSELMEFRAKKHQWQIKSAQSLTQENIKAA